MCAYKTVSMNDQNTCTHAHVMPWVCVYMELVASVRIMTSRKQARKQARKHSRKEESKQARKQARKHSRKEESKQESKLESNFKLECR